MSSSSSMLTHCMLGVALLLAIVGLALTLIGVIAPAWQVVEIREFRAEHQHGLWWDCVRGVRFVVSTEHFYDESPLHCMYKLDSSADLVIENALNAIDQDGAVGEAEYHKFWTWHKIVLFFTTMSFMLAFCSILSAPFAPWLSVARLMFAVGITIAACFSLMADAIAFFSMQRIDTRFVQGMVGVYEQQIGYAFYLHFGGTCVWLLVSPLSLIIAVKQFSVAQKMTEKSDSQVQLFVPARDDDDDERARAASAATGGGRRLFPLSLRNNAFALKHTSANHQRPSYLFGSQTQV